MEGDVIYLCDYCKNYAVIFPVKAVSYGYEEKKCYCCKKRRSCRSYKMIPKNYRSDLDG